MADPKDDGDGADSESVGDVDPKEVDAVANELANSPTTNPDAYSYKRPDGTTATPGIDESTGSAPVQPNGTPLSPSEAKAYKTVASGGGTSSSKSSSGVTDAGLARVKNGIQTPMEREIADDTAQLDSNRQQDEAAASADADAERAQVIQRGELEKAHQDKLAELESRHFDMVQTWADLDQKFSAESAAQAQQYIGAYEKQLAAARQVQVRSPYGGLGALQAAGVSGAAFAQGFLAARYGVHIDAISQIDKWVDQSIQEQERNKQNMLDSANDQLNLWHIARETSNTEWEARQRYRGLILQGMQVSMQQEAARFGGDLALNDASSRSAHIQTELDGTKRALREQFYKDVHTAKQDARDQAYKMGVLAIQKASEAETARHNQAVEKATAAPTAPPPDLVVSDVEPVMDKDGNPVTDSQGNTVVRNLVRVKPGLPQMVTQKAYDDAQEAKVNYEKYLTATNNMIKSYQDAKAIRDQAGLAKDAGWEVLARADGTGKVQRFLQDRQAWVMAKVYNDSGKQVNDQEFKRQSDQAYKDLVFADNGDKAEQSFAQLRRNGRTTFEAHLHRDEYEPISPQDPTNAYGRKVVASPMTAAQDTAQLDGKPQLQGVVDKELAKVPAKDSEEVETKRVSGTWADFQRSQPSTGDDDVTIGQPHYAVALDHIADAFVDPKRTKSVLGPTLGATKNETPEEIRQAAFDAIQAASTGDKGNKYPPQARAYAHHLYMLLPEPGEFDTDPEGAQAKLDQLRARLTWRPGTKE